MTKDLRDVVIVGAGAIGCAIGYFLSKQGVRVTVIERDAIAEHASGHAPGGFSPIVSPTMHETPGMKSLSPALIRESCQIHQSIYECLKEEGGVDYHFVHGQRIALAFNESEVGVLKTWADLQHKQGAKVEWLDKAAVMSLDKRISPLVLGGACLEHRRLVSYQYVLALAQAGERHGMQIRNGEVIGLKTKSGKLTGLKLTSGELPCEKAVLAMGPWSSLAARWIDLQVPVSPLKGQIVRLRVSGAPFPKVLSWGPFHMGTKPDGLVWAGATQENAGFDDRPTVEGRDHIISGLTSMVPALAESELVIQTACLRPVSGDGLPMLGEIPTIRGAYLATGHGDYGLLLSALTGRIMSELITERRTSFPIETFDPTRFGSL